MSLTINSVKPFKVIVGPRRGEAILGQLQIGDNSRLSADTEPTEISWFDGNEIVPAVFNAWGRRVVDGEKGKKVDCEITDAKYKGEIEFLEWGSSQGYQIMCRYLKGQFSLDYYYQVNRLGLPAINSPLAKDTNFITLAMGEREIDAKDKVMALLMQVHPLYKQSICRGPNINTWSWEKMEEIELNRDKAEKITYQEDAVGVIKSAASSGKKLTLLYDILGVNLQYDKTDETTKYDAMVVYARNNPDKVFEAVLKHQNSVQEVVAKAQAYEVFDLSTAGVIKIKIGETKSVLIDDIPAKKDNTLEWFVENSMEPAVFEAYGKLKSYAESDFK